MKSIKKEVVDIPIEDIVPDENQPRKYFDPVKIKNLKDSIEKYGIMNPVTVEKVGNKYLLVDGERRFRAATEVKLKEIPAVVIAPQSTVDRLIQQFHIQEQHEGWTPTEKAQTIGELSKELGIGFTELGKMLGIDESVIRRYVAFHSLLEKKDFVKNEVNIDFAPAIKSILITTEKLYMDKLKKPFDQTMKRKLEKAIFTQIREGELRRPGHLSKLKDSFLKSPKDIETFIEKGSTVSELFLSTKAQGAYNLRNASNNASYLANHIKLFLGNPDAIPSDTYIKNFKNAKSALDALFKKLEE